MNTRLAARDFPVVGIGCAVEMRLRRCAVPATRPFRLVESGLGRPPDPVVTDRNDIQRLAAGLRGREC